MKRLLAGILLGSVLWSAPSRADTKICVDVKLHEPGMRPPLAPPPPSQTGPQPPPTAEPRAAAAMSEEQRQLLVLRQQVQELAERPPLGADARSVLPIGQNPIEYLRLAAPHRTLHHA